MISREQLKLEIDSIHETYIEILHRIILAFQQPNPTPTGVVMTKEINPLKNSITFERDLVSPINVSIVPW